jgi:hypothetical protein
MEKDPKMMHAFYSITQQKIRSMKDDCPSANVYLGKDGEKKYVTEVKSIVDGFDPEQFVKEHKLEDIKYVGIVDASKNLFF